MAQRSKGFIKLEWTCPNCGTRNPGPQQTCTSCGSPQPDNVQFEMGANSDLVTDEKEIQRAAAGADISCAYCGTRNPATQEACIQCGADLKEGKKRESGRELGGGTMAKEVACKNCGAVNPSSNFKCDKCGTPLPRAEVSQPAEPQAAAAKNLAAQFMGKQPKKMPKGLLIGIGALLVLLLCCCGIFGILSNVQRESVTSTVQSVSWNTSVKVQEQQEAHYSDRSSAPSGAYNVSCSDSSREVCTERTIDRGNGYAEVVEDCHTETETSCSYDIMEWTTIRTDELKGNDLNPVYPKPSISSDQRLGEQSLNMSVHFASGHDYSPSTIADFQQFQIGSSWDISISMLGTIISVTPH